MPNQLIAVRRLTRDFPPPFSALTWHESDPTLFLPPNAIERELTLTKAWSYHFSNAIVPGMWNAPDVAAKVADWERGLEMQLAKLGDHGEPTCGTNSPDKNAMSSPAHRSFYPNSLEYGTEADFESALRKMIDASLPTQVKCKQQHRVAAFRFDMMLFEETGPDAKKQKLVIIELKYVRKNWLLTGQDGNFKLGDKSAFKSFEQHLEDVNLKGRVEAAQREYVDAVECHGLFVVAIHGGKYRVGSYVPKAEI